MLWLPTVSVKHSSFLLASVPPGGQALRSTFYGISACCLKRLEALWPADKAMHCNWGLSFLRKLEPRAEQIELESALATLEHGL